MSSTSESVEMADADLTVSSPAPSPSIASLTTTTTTTSVSANAPVPRPSASSTPITAKKKGKSEAKKRKIGDEVSNDTSEELAQLEKTVDFYRNECGELVAKIDSMEMKAVDQETDYLRKIAKKDEQLRTQNDLMTKGKEEILRLRAAVAELEAEKDELRQRIANKEKADRELEEAEADRKFKAKQQEFGDLLNRYEPSFPFRYRKFYINPRYFSNSSASGSGSGQKYKIPRKPTTTAEEPLFSSGQSDLNHVSLVGTLSTHAPHPGVATAPAPRDHSFGSSTPSESGESHRFTKLPPYCKKFLKGECSFGASCRFIHVSEGKLFAYLVDENFNFILPRRETKNPDISEARQAPGANVLGGPGDNGCQPHPCRQN